MDFTGFTPETMDFLWGIRFNNNREWFSEHKAQYQRSLYEPMKALARGLAPVFDGAPEMRLHLSRIYRDMRMHPTTYYKDSLWFHFQQPHSGSTLENPCLCFELRPEGYRYGFLLWCARARQMEELRQRMKEQPEKFSQMIRKAEKESGIPLDGDRYARPKPCDDPRLERFFAFKNLTAIRDCPPDDRLFSPELIDEVAAVFRAWLPVCQFTQL